jgi:sugar phosphate isomerase/epimerase
MKKNYLFLLLCFSIFSLKAQKQITAPEIGVVQDIENDSILKVFGYKYLVENTQKLISPRTVSERQFQFNLDHIKASRIPVYACNIFIPGQLKVVGLQVDEPAVLQYVDSVFQRARQAGLKMIIWGSGGSRRVPEGFDRAKAKEQFISIARKVATAAAKYNLILALENLNSTEANFINTVKEALEIVKAVDHKNFRLCTDIYHMLKEGESPDIIADTKGYVVYCEVAEKEARTPPGVKGDDFRPYFAALKNIGYDEKIVLECRWQNVATQGNTAYQILRKQIDDAYRR